MLLSKCIKEKFFQAPGGPKAIGLEDPEVMEAAKYALKAIDGGSNSNFKHALLKVVEAKVQVITDNLLLVYSIGQVDFCATHVHTFSLYRMAETLGIQDLPKDFSQEL